MQYYQTIQLIEDYLHFLGSRPTSMVLGLEVVDELLRGVEFPLDMGSPDYDRLTLFGIPVELDYVDTTRICINDVEFAYVL